MRYALTIALALLACKKTEQPHRERAAGETPSSAARTKATPQRAERGGESMRPDSTIPKPMALQLSDIKWSEGPPALPRGAQASVLEGEPPFATEKTFTFLVKLPKNYTIPPHRHLVTERVTVLQGVLSFGHGETLDRAAATKVNEGGLVLLPARHPHYAFTGDREATIALTGVGPWEIIYVDPNDDPRPTPARMPEHPIESKWDAPIEPKVIQSEEVLFQAPPTGLYPPDVKMAVLEGDPNQAKTFVARLQFARGAKMPVHSHSHTERYFMISGKPTFAFGDTWDDQKLQLLDAPAVAIIPPGTMHYARMDDRTVIQVFGVGPLDVKFANPAQRPGEPELPPTR